MRLPRSLARLNAVTLVLAVVNGMLNAHAPVALTSYSSGHVVHVVPFAHVDPGWKFTFDEHYRDVKKILKPVLLELLVGPKRSFAWEGSAYMTRWLEDFERVNLDEFEGRIPSRSTLPQLRPPWTQEEARIVQRRIAEACSPDHGPIVLGTGSCQAECPRFLDASFLGAKLQRRNNGAGKDHGHDNLLCPSWSGLARYLVRVGQLDIVGGGWVSHDEALSSVTGIINQLTLGRRSLLALGMNGPVASTCALSLNSSSILAAPSVSWQVDSFGLSASTAKLFKEFGYRGHIGARLPWTIKEKMTAHRDLEYTWEFSTPLSGESDCGGLLTTILDKHYSAPQGTDFKVSRPISRTSRAPPRRAAKEVMSILGRELDSRAANHRTPLQILPMGDDFRFLGSSAAYRHFAYLDAFIAHASSKRRSGPAGKTSSGSFDSQNWSIAYSSPTRYIAALSKFSQCDVCREDGPKQFKYQRKRNSILPSRQHGDFFPYRESFNNDWSGFFGSRPVLKNLIRKLESFQASSEAVFALALLHSEYNEDDVSKTRICKRNHGCLKQRALQKSIKLGREVSALLLHHDAITGTCRKSVARDYMRKGKAARRAAEHVMSESLISLLRNDKTETEISINFGTATKKNPAEAAWQASQSRRQLEFHVFNSLATPRNRLVSLGTNFTCSDAWTVYGPLRNAPGCRYLRKSGGEYLPSQLSESRLIEKLLSADGAIGPIDETCELLVEVPLTGLEAVTLIATPVLSRFDGENAYRYRAVRSKEQLVDVGAMHRSKHGVLSYDWSPFQSSKNKQWPLSDKTCSVSAVTSNVQRLRIAFSASPLAQTRRESQDYSIGFQIFYDLLGSTSNQRNILSTELREYKSANGFGPKLGWVGSGGAYVFRSILSALFGTAILAALGYVVMLTLIISWQRRRKMRQGKRWAVYTREATIAFNDDPHKSVFERGNYKFSCLKRSEIALLLFSACLVGYWLAHETLRGKYDWLIFERSHLIAKSQHKRTSSGLSINSRDDDDGELLGFNTAKTSSFYSDSHQAEKPSDDAQFLIGALFVSPGAAILTALAFAVGGLVGGIGALPCAAFIFTLTCVLNPDYQSRPLYGSLGASGADNVSLLVSEGPLSSSMYCAFGKGEHRSAQAFVVRRSDWLQMNVIEMITSVTAPVGHEVVARVYSSSTSILRWMDRAWTTFKELVGLYSTCEILTDDGLLQSKPIRFSPWISLSATFHPIRNLMTVSCAGNHRSSFTLIPFAPTGARVTSSPGGAEVMLHRSLAVDDEKGLGEPLLDESRAQSHHLLALGHRYDREYSTTFAVNKRLLASSFFNPISALRMKVEERSYFSHSNQSGPSSWQGLQTGFMLPESISLVSLQWWHLSDDFPPLASMMKSVCHKLARKILFLRFQQLDVASEFSQNVEFDEVDLNQMFRPPRGLMLCFARETSLDFFPKAYARENNLSGKTGSTLPGKNGIEMVSFSREFINRWRILDSQRWRGAV